MFSFEYIALGLVGVTALLIVSNLLIGLLRGLKNTIGYLVAIVASALIAGIITAIVCTPQSALMLTVIDFIKNSLNFGELQELFAVPEIAETLSYYFTMIVAPFFFLAVYFVLSVILSITSAIICIFIPPRKKDKKKKGVAYRLGGLGVGVACGLIVSLIVLMPVVGVVDIAATVGEAVFSDESIADAASESDFDVVDLVNDAADNEVMKVYRVGCGWMFDMMASANFEGERVYLKNDIATVASIVPHVYGVTSDMNNFGDDQIGALNEMINNLDRSTLLKHTLAGVVSEMAGKWTVGEKFLGVEKISTGEILDPMIDSMIGVFATTTKDTISQDLRTTVNVFDVLVENEMLSNLDNYDHLLTKLGKEGVIGELIVVVSENQRMDVVSDEITRLSVRALAITLEVPHDSQELYDDVMNDIVIAMEDSRNSGRDRETVIAESIALSFQNHGMLISNEEAMTVAESLVSDLGNLSDLEADDVEEFFLVYSAAAPASDTVYTGNGSAYVGLSAGNSIAVNSDGTITIGDRVLDPAIYNTNNYAASAAFKLGESGAEIGDAAYLYSAEKTAEISTMVTLEEILSHVNKYSDCEDAETEAQKISEMFAVAADLFAGEGIEGKTHEQLIADMGALLDKMGETEVFGQESINCVMKAILQSSTVKDEMGLSVNEASNFADKLNNLANKDETYAEVTGTISSTITMVNSVNDENISKEERRENTQKLIENLDPEKADMLSSMVTPSSMVKYGSSEEKAENVSNSVSDLFNNMANFNADPESDAYKNEADAVNTVLDLAMKGSDAEDDRRLFGTGDNAGKLDTTAEDFVSIVVESEVVSATIKNAAATGEENPYGINAGAEDKQELTAAMNEYYLNNRTDENEAELQARLNAIAAITDMPAMFPAE
ncbi:MAG: hypothetical protein E7649_05895 [Ruminococcaceae bacterium]|nr:hypothetical protein [Oscillospiraceae bacterium]